VGPRVELPDAVFTGTGFLIAYDSGDPRHTIITLRVALDGTQSPARPVVRASRGRPVLAWAGRRAWLIYYAEPVGILRRLLDAAGAPLGPTEILHPRDRVDGGDVITRTLYTSAVETDGDTELLTTSELIDDHMGMGSISSALALIGAIDDEWNMLGHFVILSGEPLGRRAMAKMGRDTIVAWYSLRSEGHVTIARVGL
jgi:hypothetical protein